MLIRPYRWYGGKIRMAHTISFLIPKHTAYYEPFMGSAAVLLNHPISKLEVINDLDQDLVHFMTTLADKKKGKLLIEKLNEIWYDRWVFDEAKLHKRNNFNGLNEIDKAVQIYVLITQSFNCTRKAFSKTAYKDTYAYRRDIQFYLTKVHERLKNVRIRNMNGIDLLGKIAENSNAFAFVDPPYRKELRAVGADKAYECELPHNEQIRLLETIQNAKCNIMLCGYRSKSGIDLYDKYLLPYGWKCYKLAEVVKLCQRQKGHRDMAEEFIWVNYELPYHAKFVISMKEYSSLSEVKNDDKHGYNCTGVVANK